MEQETRKLIEFTFFQGRLHTRRGILETTFSNGKHRKPITQKSVPKNSIADPLGTQNGFLASETFFFK